MIWMGVIQTSKDEAPLVTDSTKVKDKGRPKGKEPKENHKTSEGASDSKKKKKFEKNLCPYCEKGYHIEDHFMKNQIDLM